MVFGKNFFADFILLVATPELINKQSWNGREIIAFGKLEAFTQHYLVRKCTIQIESIFMRERTLLVYLIINAVLCL